MKCKFCGGEVGSTQLNCPFCNGVNDAAVMKKKELEQQIHRNKQLEKVVLERSKWDIANRILTRSIIAAFAVLGFTIAAGFILYRVTGGNVKGFSKSQNYGALLEESYQSHNFKKLYWLLEEYNLSGPDYYSYVQIALLDSNFNRFKLQRDILLEDLDSNGALNDKDVLDLFRYGSDTLCPSLGQYSQIAESNEKILKSYQEEVACFLTTYLGFTDEDITCLSRGAYTSNQEKEWLFRAKEQLSNQKGDLYEGEN